LRALGQPNFADRAPKGRHRLLVINLSLFTDSLSPLRGSANLTNLTQGSQSLTLVLTLTAAPQLVAHIPHKILFTSLRDQVVTVDAHSDYSYWRGADRNAVLEKLDRNLRRQQ